MSRNLAEDRCLKAGHLLAYVTGTPDGMLVHVNASSLVKTEDGKFRRDRRAKVPFTTPADKIGGWDSLPAVCGCRDEHNIDLTELVARARQGGSIMKPKLVPPIRRTTI